jgi:hypothetical protein
VSSVDDLKSNIQVLSVAPADGTAANGDGHQTA